MAKLRKYLDNRLLIGMISFSVIVSIINICDKDMVLTIGSLALIGLCSITLTLLSSIKAGRDIERVLHYQKVYGIELDLVLVMWLLGFMFVGKINVISIPIYLVITGLYLYLTVSRRVIMKRVFIG